MSLSDEVPEGLKVYARVNRARTRLGSALAYAAAGIPVFRCYSVNPDETCSCGRLDCGDVGKHPCTENGFKDATTDRAVINEWWRRRQNANIGIWVGGAGWTVIDVDPEGFEAWEMLAERLELPPTLQARSGRGGRHVVYRTPEGMRICNSPGKLLAGIDVRGAGGYIIAAPSVHENGRQYAWEQIRSIEPLPPALLKMLQRPATVVKTDARPSRDFITTGTPLYEGCRDIELTRIAGAAGGKHGMDEEELRVTLHEVNANRCRPPLPDGQVENIVRSALGWKRGRDACSGLARVPAPRASNHCECGRLYVILGDGTRRCDGCKIVVGRLSDA